MAAINQLDDNNHGSGGSTSSAHEITRVNASNEAEMERMIRRYLENMSPMIRANQSEDDNNHGAGGSASSVDELAMVSTSTEICGNKPSNSGSQLLQFQFLNGISTPVFTRKNIEGKDNKPLVVALVDQSSGQIVRTGAESATEVEIVVLEGDCNNVEADNWTSDEFNNKIVSEWNGKKVLQGKTLLKLKDGIGSTNKIAFTHNSLWKGIRYCRLGVRSKDSVFAIRIKEAKTESFLVRDKRKLLYNKHPTPSLFDHVYRLNMISRRSDCFTHLSKANIKTVMDLRTLNAINPERLKDLLKVHHNKWKTIMDHAHKCKDNNGIYLYHHSRDDQRRDGVVFNVSGQLVGLVSDSQFLPCDKLSNDRKVVVSASEHWDELIPFNDETSLINHLHSRSRTTLISFPNPLNLVIPQTSLITPISPTNDSKINIIDGVTPTGQLSQSPKRPASSEHDISISPKKPRDNQSLGTPNASTSIMTNMTSTSEVVNDDNEYLKYLNLSEFGFYAQKWKRVWCVVGWISIFSKIRSRHQLLPTSDNDTLMVITASVEHVQI